MLEGDHGHVDENIMEAHGNQLHIPGKGRLPEHVHARPVVIDDVDVILAQQAEKRGDRLTGAVVDGVDRLPAQVVQGEKRFARKRVIPDNRKSKGHPTDLQKAPLPHPEGLTVEALDQIRLFRNVVLDVDVGHPDLTAGLLGGEQNPEIVKKAAFFQDGGADADAVFIRADFLQTPPDLIAHLDKRAGALFQEETGGRERNALAGTEKEFRTQILLQGADLMQHGTGGQKEKACCLGEAAAVADG